MEESHDDVSYPEVFAINGLDESSVPICGKGLNRHNCGAYIMHHNATSMRKVHGIFDDVTARHPDMASLSSFVVEGFSAQAVMAVPGDSTATPYREYPLLALVPK